VRGGNLYLLLADILIVVHFLTISDDKESRKCLWALAASLY